MPIEIRHPLVATLVGYPLWLLIYGGDPAWFPRVRSRLLWALVVLWFVGGVRWRLADSDPLVWRPIYVRDLAWFSDTDAVMYRPRKGAR